MEKLDIASIMDPALAGTYDLPSALRMACAAIMCLRQDPVYRPSLDDVAIFLEGHYMPDDRVC